MGGQRSAARPRHAAAALGAVLLACGASAQSTSICLAGRQSPSYDCAAVDYTICTQCYPNGAPNVSTCLQQPDSSSDRLCAVSGTVVAGSPVTCVGCTQLTEAQCAGTGVSANCEWNGTLCRARAEATATPPLTDSSGVRCTEAPTLAPTAEPTMMSTFTLGTSSRTLLNTWYPMQGQFDVPANAHSLLVTLQRNDDTASDDNYNLALFDNISVSFVGSRGVGQNELRDGDASSQDNWISLPGGRPIISLDSGLVFAILPTNNPSHVMQLLDVPRGSTAVAVMASMRNNASNTEWNGIIQLQFLTLTQYNDRDHPGTFPPTPATMELATQTFDVTTVSRNVRTWIQFAKTVAVPNGASALALRLARYEQRHLADSGNVAYFDNVSVVFSGCVRTASPCGVLDGVNMVLDSEGTSTDAWVVDPARSTHTAVLDGEAVFILGPASSDYAGAMYQVMPVPEGASTVSVLANVYNTVGNSGIGGFGLLEGLWIDAVDVFTQPPTLSPTAVPTTAPTAAPTSPTHAPTLVPTPAVSSQTFVVEPVRLPTAAGQFVQLEQTSVLFRGTNALEIKLSRNVTDPDRDGPNVVYFTNVSVVWACLASTRCVAEYGSTTNAVVNGDARVRYSAGSPWTSQPVNFVTAVVDQQSVFHLAADASLPDYMLQTVVAPPGAYAATIRAMVYNTATNTGNGHGYMRGRWLTVSTNPPTMAPTTRPSSAPTAAPTVNQQACAIPSNKPLVTSIAPLFGDSGTVVTISGTFQRHDNLSARCFWWHDGLVFASFLQGSVVSPTSIECVAPRPPIEGASARVSLAVWVPGVDTRFTRACMTHTGTGQVGRFVDFQYTPTRSPTVAVTHAPTSAASINTFSVPSSPNNTGSCTACISCPPRLLTISGVSGSDCITSVLVGVGCLDDSVGHANQIDTAYPTPPPTPSCQCPEILSRADMAVPDTLPEFPATQCGTIRAVPCYQLSQQSFGRGQVTLECLGNGTWNYSSWDATSCTRRSIADLIDTTVTDSPDGIRAATVRATAAENMASVVEAVSNTLLLGSRDVVVINDWITSIVQGAVDRNLQISCRTGTELVTAIYKLMLVSDLARRRGGDGQHVASMVLGVRLNGVTTTASEFGGILATGLNRINAALIRSDSDSQVMDELNWTVTCQVDAGSDGWCVPAGESQLYRCRAETSWHHSYNQRVRRLFWLPFQNFFTATMIESVVERQLPRAVVTVNIEQDVAVRTYEAAVQNYGPALAALAPLLLEAGTSVSVRGKESGVLLRSDNCSRLAAGSTSPIRLNFGTDIVDTPVGCSSQPNLDQLNVTQLAEEMTILRSLGFVNGTNESTGGGAVPLPSIIITTTPVPTHPPASLDFVDIDPATLRRLYQCDSLNAASAAALINRGQSLSIFAPGIFMRLTNRTLGDKGFDESVTLTTELVDGNNTRQPKRLQSRVVSLSLGGADEYPNAQVLDPPVLLTFTGLTPGQNHTCAFYSFADRAFRTDGVTLVSVSDDGSTIVCSTVHTTNFAVLTSSDGSASSNSDDHTQALSIIMYIGLAVSLVCYSIIVATYALHRNLLTLGKEVLCHICGTLAIGETAFVIGVLVATEGSPSSDTCTSLGVIAHYFLLAAFSWMLCEAIFMHTNFTAVFQAFVRNDANSARRYAAFSYGGPLVVVIVTLVVVPDAYDNHDAGDGHHCFLDVDNGAIWAFIGPMIAILLANFIMLVRVVNVVSRVSVRKVEGLSPTDEQKHVTRVRTKRALHASMSFFFLLGLGWIFGVVAVGDVTLFFQYVFSVLLMLQGLCLFYFHCYSDADARAAWYRVRMRSRSSTSTLPAPGVVRGKGRHQGVITKSPVGSASDILAGIPDDKTKLARGGSTQSGAGGGAYIVIDGRQTTSEGTSRDHASGRATPQTGSMTLSGGETSLSSNSSSNATPGNSMSQHSDAPASFGSEDSIPPTPQSGALSHETFAL
eukprot:m.165023 g.165023  ORF g.165023 m.165023 type:complete len:1949 (-) comp12503_c0_seq1:113-5959(-)